MPIRLCPLFCYPLTTFTKIIEVRDQPHVIERILRHCKLWNPPCRTPPAPPEQLDLEYVPIDDFAEAL